MYFRKRGDLGEIIIEPLYQRGEVMNSRTAGRKSVFFTQGILPYFFLLFFLLIGHKPANATSQNFRVVYPAEVHSGDPFKIHVIFQNAPPSHVFYLLEVAVDGNPVAMADLSEERSTWITAPPQPPGRHQLAVIWRNPPGGSPVASRKDLVILPKK